MMSKINNVFTKRKTSSAPLKRKMIGRGGTQPESTICRAVSSIDAESRKAKTKKQKMNHSV